MKEIQITIQELTEFKQSIENDCCVLLGDSWNVPSENFDQVLLKLLDREKVKFTLETLKDVSENLI